MSPSFADKEKSISKYTLSLHEILLKEIVLFEISSSRKSLIIRCCFADKVTGPTLHHCRINYLPKYSLH